MKKAVCCGLVLALLLAMNCVPSLAGGKTTTLLVYMCGSDMQDLACDDIEEMADVEAGDTINMVVLAGGSREWDFEDFRGSSRTFTVIRDGYFEDLEDWGKASMGSSDSLKEFLVYGITKYPADRVIVVLWDHGAGSEGGVCFDETAGDDGLTISEINEALAGLKQSVPDYHINIFGCDACMMASYEMAAMLSRHNIDYYVASEETENGFGWYYASWLGTLKSNPSISDPDLCGEIIDGYIEDGLRNDPYDYMTLSAIDLSKVGALEASMEQFASVMSGQISGGNLSAVRRGRSRMYTFGSYDDGSWDMVDLGAMLDEYAQFDSEAAAEAKRCLARAVIASKQTDNLDRFSGLSILMPQDAIEEFDEYKNGITLPGVTPNWMDFVCGYVSMLQGGSYHFSASSAGPISPDTEITETFVPAHASPSGSMKWDDETESYGETPSEEIRISDSDRGFTAVLPQEDLAYLDYVEGMLLMDMSDDEMECYVDFGLMQNNLIDWKTGRVCSLFDGTWPVFGGQPVPLYDQSSNENSRRSLIPVKLNGEYTYLVVVFPAGSTEGKIIGANAGYDQSGLPIRNTTKLKAGDEIIPVYTMYYAKDEKEELQEAEFDGDKIIWEEGMTVTYAEMSDEGEKVEMLFCFVFNDIFGEDTMSEMISFEL